ncbi:DUF6708 domain-containing protein [Paraburkholderia fungorum]|uniref:DUF6708 domain-containing protein n=1 Tax=Paraburkholderia fungorum TaxID=134537 RepID=UPI00094316B2|nr:DUF6708 domain-containing protein [Paraburkholderia fungorum]
MQKENFTWRRFPIRFNRQIRMVYAYRVAGSKGVIAVPREKAFFYVQRRDEDAVSRTTSFNIRCHVLDESQNVTQSFSVGSRVTTLSDESTDSGGSIVATLNDQFEYFRRYINDGPVSLPYLEFVPTAVSPTNSYRLVTRTDRNVIAEGNSPMTLLMWIVRPFALLTALLHYIGQVTSREPVWPESVSGECKGQPVGQDAGA